MKIISGIYRGRKINTFKDKNLRPTTTQTREAIFNILTHHEELPDLNNSDITFLEVFGGSAIMSFEAISRGLKKAIVIDRNPRSKKLCEENSHFLNDEEIKFFVFDIEKLPKAPDQADLCFIDPPYRLNLEEISLNSLHKGNWLNNDATVILETDKRNQFEIPEQYNILFEKLYGKTRLIFLKYSN